MNRTLYNIYNLEFESFVETIQLGAFSIKRADNYKEKVLELQHLVDISGPEIHYKLNTGTHVITAIAECTNKPPKALLPWENKGEQKTTQLDDICFILSLINHRSVFSVPTTAQFDVVIADPRIWHYGGVLSSSLPMEIAHYDYLNNTWFDTPRQGAVSIGKQIEPSIKHIFSRLEDKSWMKKYHHGYYLFLFRQAMQRASIETTFSLCWTIWEHLFSVLNQSWMSKKTIINTPSVEKLSFLLHEFFTKEQISDTEKKHLGKIVDIRNRIVHFGRKPEERSYKEMELFIRLTESLVAYTLELHPSNIFNTKEDFAILLEGKDVL